MIIDSYIDGLVYETYLNYLLNISIELNTETFDRILNDLTELVNDNEGYIDNVDTPHVLNVLTLLGLIYLTDKTNDTDKIYIQLLENDRLNELNIIKYRETLNKYHS